MVDPSGPATDLHVPLEIIIGTVPLQNFQHVFAQAAFNATQYNEPSAPMPVLPPSSPPADGAAPSARKYE